MVSTEKEILKAGDYVRFQFCYTVAASAPGGQMVGRLVAEHGAVEFMWIMYKVSNGSQRAALLKDIAIETLRPIPKKEVFMLKLEGKL